MKKNNDICESINYIEKIEENFEDIVELSKMCKFSNCTHTNELKCAVREAIDDGSLSEERFNSYYSQKKEIEYIFKEKNKTKAIDYMKQKKLFQK